MPPQKRVRRPQVHDQHWVTGVLYLREAHRANLYWTPDPEHSPVLRTLQGGEPIEFVPEIKFSHWVIVRLEHQLGWVTLENVEIIEDAQPVVDPAQFLDEPPTDTAPRPSEDIEETMVTRPPELDQRIRANMEAEDAPEPARKPTTADGDEVSTGDLRRLIRFVTGKLTGALNRDDPS